MVRHGHILHVIQDNAAIFFRNASEEMRILKEGNYLVGICH